MNKIKGIIFDFNGVLWWDSHLHDKAWKIFSKKIRGRELDAKEMEHNVHGRINRDIVEYLAGKQLTKDKLEDLTEQKESIYRGFCRRQGEKFKLAPGAVGFLDFLKENNIPRTIATSSDINNLKFYFANLPLSKWFDFNQVMYNDGSIKGKPAPDIYEKAADKLGLKPNDCLVIEDSRSGIASAHAAKISVIIAIGPAKDHERLSKLDGVSEVASDFYEVLEIVKKYL